MKVTRPKAGESPVGDEEIKTYLGQLPGWSVIEQEGEKRLQKAFTFPDFLQALAFTDRIGQLAQAEDHHPAILTEWAKATVTWWTHKIGGLHRNDFIMAAKTDQIYHSIE